jgi:hypothetical protein
MPQKARVTASTSLVSWYSSAWFLSQESHNDWVTDALLVQERNLKKAFLFLTTK